MSCRIDQYSVLIESSSTTDMCVCANMSVSLTNLSREGKCIKFQSIVYLIYQTVYWVSVLLVLLSLTTPILIDPRLDRHLHHVLTGQCVLHSLACANILTDNASLSVPMLARLACVHAYNAAHAPPHHNIAALFEARCWLWRRLVLTGLAHTTGSG